VLLFFGSVLVLLSEFLVGGRGGDVVVGRRIIVVGRRVVIGRRRLEVVRRRDRIDLSGLAWIVGTVRKVINHMHTLVLTAIGASGCFQTFLRQVWIGWF